jgi:predicted nucleic acid-binding protein
MVYVDANVLVYAAIEQDLNKKRDSIDILKKYFESNELCLSTLVLQEYAYTLARLKVDQNIISSDIEFYSNVVKHDIGMDIFYQAVNLCCSIDNFININDVIHLKFAEKYCSGLVTYDKDFSKLKPHTKIQIEIIG